MTDRVIIEHKDGRAYSVTRADFARLYEPEGFEVTGEENASAFIADVPRPATRAGARRKSRKTVRPAKPADAPTEEPQP